MLDWIFPQRCLVCRKFLKKEQTSLCHICEEIWPQIGSSSCPQCSYPYTNSSSPSHLCGDCLTYPKQCLKVRALGVYRGVLLEMIHRLKYSHEEHLAHFLGGRMAGMCDGSACDLILPVPMTKRRLRERGYNQSVLLAKTLARIWKKECDPFLLKKVDDTPPQAQLQGKERRKNLRKVFSLQEPRQIEGKSVLLVDDVYTTGATVEALTAILIDAGALEVCAAVVARAGGEPR